jgi:hypothetical protein
MPAKPVKRVQHERKEQVRFIGWVRAYLPHLRRLVWAVPNQAARFGETAAKLVAEGVESETPDVFVALPRAGFAGLFLEFKRADDEARLDDGQDETLRLLSACGYAVAVVRGATAGWAALMAYLEL